MKNSTLFSIFLIILIDILGFAVILPLLPFYAESFGATPIVVGWLLSSFSVCQFVAGPILGQISDRIGRKPVLIASQIGTLIGFLILGFARSLPLIFISRIIDGLTAGNISVAQAYISDVTKEEDRAKSFGLIGVAFGFGFLVGPALAGFLTRFGHQCPIFVSAGLSLTSIFASIFLLPKSKDEIIVRESARQNEERPLSNKRFNFRDYFQFFREPGLSGLFWQFLYFIFSFSILFSGFALFVERRYFYHGEPFGAKEVGYLFAYGGFVGMLIQGAFIGPLVRFFTERRLIVTGFIFMGSGFVYLGMAFSVLHLVISTTVVFLGMALLRPCLTSLISKKAGFSRQGAALGLTQSLMAMSQIAAPFFSGALIEHRFLMLWALTGALACAGGFFLSAIRNQGA